MNAPTKWELFQNLLIATVAGVISSGIQDRGFIYVSILTFMFWIFLLVSFKFAKPFFARVESLEDDEDNEDRPRPYQDVDYAS